MLAGRRAWSRMRPADFDASWSAIRGPLVAVTSAAQLAAATAAAGYVPAVLAEQGIDATPEAVMRPQAFAGVAFDGRSLSTLLEGAVRESKRYVGLGLDGGDALALGKRWLEGALQTIVSDAARDAAAVATAVRPQVTSWVRMVNPPCCSRCAVLAGAVYKWNRPCPRHPRCDCFTIPTTVAKGTPLLTDARELFRQGQITDLTPAQAQRITDGADLVKVLNESRDAWRTRMAVERKTAQTRTGSWGTNTPTPLPPGGIQDFLSHLTSRMDAINEMKRHGLVS